MADWLDAAAFLASDWQVRPRLFESAFADFQFPVTPDELAGLALEDDVESRLVVGNDAEGYRLEHGPLAEARFASLGERDWTLLVSEMDALREDVEAFLASFDFLPRWRIDDIMISYAAPGGSVGPHVDQYDVFLVQARGTREWHLDMRGLALEEHCQGDLRLVEGFTPTVTHVCHPGDVLYLPPGVPHHGIGMDGDCMTWSVGMRAPLLAELLTEIASRLPPDLRYSDPGRPPGDGRDYDAKRLREVLGQMIQTIDAAELLER